MVAIGASLLQSVLTLSGFGPFGPKNLTDLFGPSLSPGAQIILPKESRWDTEVRQRWSVYQAPTYLGAIKPATKVDIQQIVCGGHGISNYSRFEGIAVDLGAFKSVHLNKVENRLTVGAAAEYSQLSNLLYDAGKELPLASCTCVGVIGATMGAGIGPLMGHRGLMLDALESVEIVTADGELLIASATQNPDLFWAIRGAGANFGIVTSATYKVYDITYQGQVMVADLVFPAVANQSFWFTLQQYDDALPPKLALTAVALYNREIEQPVIVLHAVYFGPQEEGEMYLEPFKHLVPLVSNIGMIPQTDMFPSDHGACTTNQRINLYTVALRRIDPPTLEHFYSNLVNMWHEYPDYDGRLLIMRYANDGPMAAPDSSTAYPWRDAIAHMNLENFYLDPSHDDSVNKLIKPAREKFAQSSGYNSLATYSNFAHGDEGPEAWYSAQRLPKLSALKKRWDPKRLFSWHNPVPVDWTGFES